jgi:hypothetical protein
VTWLLWKFVRRTTPDHELANEPGTRPALSFRITTIMKRTTLTFLALSASLLTGGYLLGQSQTKGAASPAAPSTQQTKLVRVATLKTVEANREFQNNVQVLQNQRQAVLELNAAWDKETDTKKKQELKTKLDAAFAKLNNDNQLMQKTYGFSVDRNYVMEIEVSNVYLVVSEEEAARLEKAEAAKKGQPEKTDKKTEKKKK